VVRLLTRDQIDGLSDDGLAEHLHSAGETLAAVEAKHSDAERYVWDLIDVAMHVRHWSPVDVAELTGLEGREVVEHSRDPDAPHHVRLGRSMAWSGALRPGH
jgi:hypothetical protein